MQNVGDLGNDSQPVWDGTGEYVAFPSNLNGGGGGGYVAPVTPVAPFVPPSYTNNVGVIITLDAGTDVVNWLSNNENIGYGAQNIINISALQLDSNTTYKAVLNGKIPSNYWVITLQKTFDYNNINSNNNTNLSNYNNIIVATEYRLNNVTGQYDNGIQHTLNSSIGGNLNLPFDFQLPAVEPPVNTPVPTTPQPADSIVEYQLAFGSNFKNELGDVLNLKYEIVDISGNILDSGIVKLSDLNSDNKKLKQSLLSNSTLNISIIGDLPSGYSYTNVYYAPFSVAAQNTNGDFSKWIKASTSFNVPGLTLLGNLAVAVTLQKVIDVPVPNVTVPSLSIDKQVKDSDSEDVINITFSATDADYVDAYLSTDKIIRVPATKGFIPVYFNKDYNSVYGSNKIILVAVGNKYGDGNRVEVLVNWIAVNDFPSITQITAPNTIDVPSFSDLNITYDVSYTSFAVTNVNVNLLAKDGKTQLQILSNLPANGNFTINLKALASTYPTWNGADNVTLIFTPINGGGAQLLTGNPYTVVTKVNYPSIKLDETIIKKTIFDAFTSHLSFSEPEPDSKYLTHLANFGNANQTLISSWEIDNWTLSKKSTDELGNTIVKPEDVVESVILKLYSPLDTSVTNNSTFWITKLITNPLIETVVLTQQDNLKCPPIKGPNFSIDVDYVKGQSTNYESLDTLILSASVSSSSKLVSQYLSSSVVNTQDLNIEYASGSTYLWDNFVHFSSAQERVNNFVYKVQLIELYEGLISSASNDNGNGYASSLASQQEVQRQTLKKNQIINGFDGFENFLYSYGKFTTSDTSSLTWPYSNSTTRLPSTSNVVINWYTNLSTLAKSFDIENTNWVQNNIPQYILNNTENESLLLFLSMVGQHFDTIYYYTKAIEKSRGLGYSSTNQISDKLLFETLKSFGWDAKNLATDAKLWDLVFGQDSAGNTKESNPAKQRTYEVWRRIANNLPYLLKHKGTARGIYALMACYGIPASNLSILEFGGPEVNPTDDKSKLVMDTFTTALVFNSGSYLEIPWNNTNKNRKPNTIEMFVKPAYAGLHTLITGSNWDVKLSGSIGSEYGVVKFNYGGGTITSDVYPIFNGRYFGISLNSGSTGLELDLRQAEKERTIFQNSYSASLTTNWNNGTSIYLGTNFTGSIDEFRLWSERLNSSTFFDHVSFPEMVNGNSVSSSTNDLYFRLDFEYPKNLSTTSSMISVDTNIYYGAGLHRNNLELTTPISGSNIFSYNVSASLSASAHGFTNNTTYPYNFEGYDRKIVVSYPNGAASRFSTNKIRFEEQNLISDLSSKSRSTVRAFDKSPTDSNRVGLFFSPTKDLNLDIAKSFGGLSIDNYIGDPSDMYNENYAQLDSLRNYYFQRFNNRNIYDYINLIKLYEKSMFDDIKNMLPARVKATTGLLIEPHFLERSKVKHRKPTAVDYQEETEIHLVDTTIMNSNSYQLESLLTSSLHENVFGDNEQYYAEITSASISNISSQNYQFNSEITGSDYIQLEGASQYYESLITGSLSNATIQSQIQIESSNQIVGGSKYEDIGFSVYCENGNAIYNHYDGAGNLIKERIKVYLVTTQYTKIIDLPLVVINGMSDLRGGTTPVTQSYSKTELVIQPFSGSITPTVGSMIGNGIITLVQPVSGYLPSHNRFVSDLSTGLQNSYYNGVENTILTTIDGASPVESFVTNPNTLKVNKAGRDISEPILEVE